MEELCIERPSSCQSVKCVLFNYIPGYWEIETLLVKSKHCFVRVVIIYYYSSVCMYIITILDNIDLDHEFILYCLIYGHQMACWPTSSTTVIVRCSRWRRPRSTRKSFLGSRWRTVHLAVSSPRSSSVSASTTRTPVYAVRAR